MPEWAVAIILGVIEGVTEFLPVSSTGHLLLAEHGLKRAYGIGQHSDLFNVVVQGGAVLAVLLLFAERAKRLVFQWREPASADYLRKLVVAFVVTALGGVVLKLLHFRLPETPAPVAWATLLGGILFLVIERRVRRRKATDDITWSIALAVAGAQLLAAVFPGLSRSGSTILMALALGLSRPAATEFSFLLGIPTLLSAGFLEILLSLHRGTAAQEAWGSLLLASLVAAVTAFVSVKWLLRFIQTHTFEGFGWYRIVVGGLILLVVH